jgi:hypothetical protein
MRVIIKSIHPYILIASSLAITAITTYSLSCVMSLMAVITYPCTMVGLGVMSIT